MAHRMGLIGMSLSAHNVYDNITYDGNTYNNETKKWEVSSYGTYNVWNGSTTFTSTDVPLVNGSKCYQVVKPNVTTPSYTTSTVTASKKYAWSQSCTAVSEANKYDSYTIDYDVDFIAATWVFSCSGQGQQWVAPKAGTYTMECWGSNGGICPQGASLAAPGIGGYVKGDIILSKSQNIYVYVGAIGTSANYSNTNAGGWNGGGYGSTYNRSSGHGGSGGGGSTDIRIVAASTSDYKIWNETNSLRSRIIVAAGGGGRGYYPTTSARWNGSYGGGLIGQAGIAATGYTGADTNNTGGTQTKGGNNPHYNNDTKYVGYFGYAPLADHDGGYGGGGGGGWYGGSKGYGRGGAGGSSFISGHPGCNAVNPSTGAHLGASTAMTIGGKEYRFISGTTKMIDGSGKEWTTASQTTGGTTVGIPAKPETTSNGYCRIIYNP